MKKTDAPSAKAPSEEAPLKVEEDGLQRRKRFVSPAEAIETDYYEAANRHSNLVSNDQSRLELLLLKKVLAENVIGDILGGYVGLADTYIMLNSVKGKSKHHPEADKWAFDEEKSTAAKPAVTSDVARKNTLLFEYATGNINRLTRLGHAVNVVKCVEDIERNYGSYSPAHMVTLGMEIGASATALQYKQYESVAAGQAKAKRQGRSKGSWIDYHSRDEWIRSQFEKLMRSPGMKKQAAYQEISEMMQRRENGFKENWSVVGNAGVETALRNRKNRKK